MHLEKIEYCPWKFRKSSLVLVQYDAVQHPALFAIKIKDEKTINDYLKMTGVLFLLLKTLNRVDESTRYISWWAENLYITQE